MIACQLLFSKSTFLYISPLFPFSLNMLFSIYAFLYKCLLPLKLVSGWVGVFFQFLKAIVKKQSKESA